MIRPQDHPMRPMWWREKIGKFLRKPHPRDAFDQPTIGRHRGEKVWWRIFNKEGLKGEVASIQALTWLVERIWSWRVHHGFVADSALLEPADHQPAPSAGGPIPEPCKNLRAGREQGLLAA